MATWHRLSEGSLTPTEEGAHVLRLAPGEIFAPLFERHLGQLSPEPWESNGDLDALALSALAPERLDEIAGLLDLFRQCVVVEPTADAGLQAGFGTPPYLYALSTTFEPGSKGKRRTPIGQMEYDAKYLYNGKARRDLGEALAAFAKRHPEFRGADAVVPVPRNPGKPDHLPEHLSCVMAKEMGIEDAKDLIRKHRRTPPMKQLPLQEKVESLRGALLPSRRVEPKRYIVVDDLIQSGTTMLLTMKALLDAGAAGVAGVACVVDSDGDGNRPAEDTGA